MTLDQCPYRDPRDGEMTDCGFCREKGFSVCMTERRPSVSAGPSMAPKIVDELTDRMKRDRPESMSPVQIHDPNCPQGASFRIDMEQWSLVDRSVSPDRLEQQYFGGPTMSMEEMRQALSPERLLMGMNIVVDPTTPPNTARMVSHRTDGSVLDEVRLINVGRNHTRRELPTVIGGPVDKFEWFQASWHGGSSGLHIRETVQRTIADPNPYSRSMFTEGEAQEWRQR